VTGVLLELQENKIKKNYPFSFFLWHWLDESLNLVLSVNNKEMENDT
jgi:hypothetical protein